MGVDDDRLDLALAVELVDQQLQDRLCPRMDLEDRFPLLGDVVQGRVGGGRADEREPLGEPRSRQRARVEAALAGRIRSRVATVEVA